MCQQDIDFSALEDVFDLGRRVSTNLRFVYENFIKTILSKAQISGKRIGALVLEPVFIGAGGFKLVDVLFQHVLVKLCKEAGIPVVYDEVAVGMYRVGPNSTIRMLQQTPEIAVYGKLVTGGYLPLSITLTTEETFNSFKSDEKSKALLHGHSYTANPITCAAALEAVRRYHSYETYDQIKDSIHASFQASDARRISLLPGVDSAVCLGSILTVDLAASTISVDSPLKSPAVRVVEILRRRGIYARPLGNTVYVMTSQVTSPNAAGAVLDALEHSILHANTGGESSLSWSCNGAAAV